MKTQGGFIPDSNDAVTVLASQLDRKKKFFSRAAAVEALVAVIKMQKGRRARAGVAASFAVHFSDELRAAKKVNTREGYLMMLEDLIDESKTRCNQYDPSGSAVAQMFPKIAAWLTTPEMVYDAEAYIEVAERMTARRPKTRAA